MQLAKGGPLEPQQSVENKALPFGKFSLIFQIDKRCDEAAMPDEIMTIKEVAEFLKIKEKTTYRLVAEGTTPGFKVGGSWRFRRVEIVAR
jgi:excisionase family DNA binding protein